MKIYRDRRGQTGGLITGIVFGIATLIVGVVVAFLVINTLTGAELFERGSTVVTNESEAWLNSTGYTLDEYHATNRFDFTITEVWSNLTSIATANATLVDGVVTNSSTTGLGYQNVSFSYTYNEKSDVEISADGLETNFSKGIDNISEQLPTVLLIAAIILILGILAILVLVWSKMNMGGGNTL